MNIKRQRIAPPGAEPPARSPRPAFRGPRAAFTLAEVLVSLLLLGLGMGGILSLYSQAAVRSDWSAYSLAAQFRAVGGIEQCRAAKFDPRGAPPVDQLVSSNFPVKVDILDVGTSLGKTTYATNTTTIVTLSTNPPLKMIEVDCTWSHPQRGLFTNTVITYRAADQ